MTHQVIWTKPVIDEFLRLGGMTKDEEDVFLTHVKNWTITKQALELKMSESKVNKITSRLKIKYDEAQKHSLILQKRAENSAELFSRRK